jgi:hypothetical protein
MRPAAAGNTNDKTEIALRALFAVSAKIIDPESQRCNLGSVYLREHSDTQGVKVGEAILAELAEMDRGKNKVIGWCKGKRPTMCYVGIFHADEDDVSSTELRFQAINGKALIRTLSCVSTP